MGKTTTKARILLGQNWFIFFLFTAWFLINYMVFLVLNGGNYLDALLTTFYFMQHESLYGNFYPVISEFVIFGVIFSVITTGFFRKYNPLQTSLALARSMKNHVIIIGYSHLGRRIRRYLKEKKIKCVVVESDEDLVSHLIKDECPIVPRKAQRIDALEDANAESARLVFTCRNDLETLIVSNSLIRDLNKKCQIITRCFDDSVAKILEKSFQCKTISTSKYASEYILSEMERLQMDKAIIIGYTNTTIRLSEEFKRKGIEYHIIEREKTKVEDIIDDEPIIIGDGKDKENLQEAGINNTDIVIILVDKADEVLLIADSVRELSQSNLICRFFHEEVGEILEKEPFNATVISQSEHALDQLIKEGVFDFKKKRS
jgi:Trk K+ transport system NAD-binding subunit